MACGGIPLVIYVVEGDAAVRDGLGRLVRSAGFRAKPFANAEELLAGLDAGSPGCVLLDLATCAPGAPSLAARLRERGVDLPCIALTAEEGGWADHEARAAGASFLMRKPVDDRALLDAIAWVSGGASP